jgi:hypothetical protein
VKLERLAFIPDLALGLVYLVAGAAAAGWLVLGIELEALALPGAWLIALAAFQVLRHHFWWPAIGLAALLGNRLARSARTSARSRRSTPAGAACPPIPWPSSSRCR